MFRIEDDDTYCDDDTYEDSTTWTYPLDGEDILEKEEDEDFDEEDFDDEDDDTYEENSTYSSGMMVDSVPDLIKASSSDDENDTDDEDEEDDGTVRSDDVSLLEFVRELQVTKESSCNEPLKSSFKQPTKEHAVQESRPRKAVSFAPKKQHRSQKENCRSRRTETTTDDIVDVPFDEPVY
jgi:hypothetical protein